MGARVVENSGILDLLIKLLEVVQPCLQAAKEQKDIQTPKYVLNGPSMLILPCKCYTSSSVCPVNFYSYCENSSFCRWITPVLLIIDFYEKMAVSSKRREQMNKVNQLYQTLTQIKITIVKLDTEVKYS